VVNAALLGTISALNATQAGAAAQITTSETALDVSGVTLTNIDKLQITHATTAGFTFGGYVTGPVLPWLELGGDVAYNDFTVDTTQPGAGAQFGPTLSGWEFHALGQAEVAFLQLFLGLGAANYSGRDDAGEAQRQTDFSWQAGAAARWFFMEFRVGYHQISTGGVNANWIGVTFGVML
jgi:hypothetical protein